MRYRLLIVEPRSRGESLGGILSCEPSFACERIDAGALEAKDLRVPAADLILVAAHSDAASMRMFERLRFDPIETPVIAVLPHAAEEALLQLVSRTVDDVIFEPIRAVELRHRLDRLLVRPKRELGEVQRRLIEEMGLAKLVGRAPAFTRAIDQIPRFARAEAPLLITGETGTGKELFARVVHHLSPRQRFPFIALDCGAIPESLFESELFGHLRGAFTDAHRDHRGLVAMAQGGTLFLDEVDSLSTGAQAKLLRLLQERTFRPLGSDRFECADVRIVAATNRDLEGCIREKRFRSDLYFRLNVLRLHLPPLRERRGDIALLAYHALKECGVAPGECPREFAAAALRRLERHDWPGNVRELCNIVQRAVVSCDAECILPGHLDLPGPCAESEIAGGGPFRAERAAALAAFERRYVEDLLRKHQGNVTHAAREARQDRRAFGRFIKKYNIDRRALMD